MFEQYTVAGRLGRDPELRYLPDGKPVCDFTIAVDQYGKDEPKWIRVTAWGKQAESCNEYLAKGRQVIVSGTVSASAWEKDGEARATLELTARDVKFIGSRNDTPTESADNSDLPF